MRKFLAIATAAFITLCAAKSEAQVSYVRLSTNFNAAVLNQTNSASMMILTNHTDGIRVHLWVSNTGTQDVMLVKSFSPTTLPIVNTNSPAGVFLKVGDVIDLSPWPSIWNGSLAACTTSTLGGKVSVQVDWQ